MVEDSYGRITDLTGAQLLGNPGPLTERRLKTIGRA